ncbi:MAG: hypothetical protein M1818_007981 [Claussenomyces sp. TS43310]|nr:MAG: hypothetical protein M1818_007981 [Claussenomyces sp. TS43310]
MSSRALEAQTAVSRKGSTTNPSVRSNWDSDGTFPRSDSSSGGSVEAGNGVESTRTTLVPAPSGYALPASQLKLLHHMSAISASIQAAESGNIVIYLKRLPIFLKIGFSYDFVMHSLMAWASSHFAFCTKSVAAENVARHYRIFAMQGLQGAISSFDEKNMDAVLSASLLLSWQAANPLEWATFNKGTSAVISAMKPYKQNSLLLEYIDEENVFTMSPNALQQPFHYHSVQDEAAALTYIYETLERLEDYTQGRRRETEIVQHLKSFVANVQRHIPIDDPRMRFYLLEPTRSMLYWLPTQLFEEARTDPVVMVVLAHLYAISLTVQPVFAGPGAAHFRGLSITPIEDIYQRLMDHHNANGKTLETYRPLSLMHFPMQSVALFRSRMGLHRGIVLTDESLAAIRYGLDPLVDAVGAVRIHEEE